jgi:hypothetical protein
LRTVENRVLRRISELEEDQETAGSITFFTKQDEGDQNKEDEIGGHVASMRWEMNAKLYWETSSKQST